MVLVNSGRQSYELRGTGTGDDGGKKHNREPIVSFSSKFLTGRCKISGPEKPVNQASINEHQSADTETQTRVSQSRCSTEGDSSAMLGAAALGSRAARWVARQAGAAQARVTVCRLLNAEMSEPVPKRKKAKEKVLLNLCLSRGLRVPVTGSEGKQGCWAR